MLQSGKALALSMVVLILFVACGKEAPTATTRPAATLAPQPVATGTPVRPAATNTPAPSPTPPPTQVPTATATPAPLALDMTAKDYDFSPTLITVQPGQTVKISLKNEAKSRNHNLAFHGYEGLKDKIGPNLEPGKSRTFELV